MLLPDINDFCDRAEKQLLARHTSGDDENSEGHVTKDEARLARWEADRENPTDKED